MADSASKSGSLLNWIGGIAATIIAGVVIFYATRQPTPPPPPPPVVVPQVGINGFVADVASHKHIPDALVTVDLGPKLATQNTDTQGRYSFILDSTNAQSQSQTVTLDILAGGYVHYSTTVNVRPGDNFAEIMVQPIPIPDPTPLPASPTVPTPTLLPPSVKILPRSALILAAPRNYDMRVDATRLTLKPTP